MMRLASFEFVLNALINRLEEIAFIMKKVFRMHLNRNVIFRFG